MLDRGLIGVCLAVALTGCMGRPPDPVPVVQPQDRYMNCTAIYAEVRENNRRVRELGKMLLPESAVSLFRSFGLAWIGKAQHIRRQRHYRLVRNT